MTYEKEPGVTKKMGSGITKNVLVTLNLIQGLRDAGSDAGSEPGMTKKERPGMTYKKEPGVTGWRKGLFNPARTNFGVEGWGKAVFDPEKRKFGLNG